MKKLVKRQLRKFRRTNNHGEREKYVKYKNKHKLLLMKKKTEFYQERLTQLKQNFKHPSKFGKQFVPSIENLSFIIPSQVNSGTNTSVEFLIRLTYSLKKRMKMMLWGIKWQVYPGKQSLGVRLQPVYVILSLPKCRSR